MARIVPDRSMSPLKRTKREELKKYGRKTFGKVGLMGTTHHASHSYIDGNPPNDIKGLAQV